MAPDELTEPGSRAGKPDAGQALAMLSAFASVGAKMFDLSITDLDGRPVRGLQRPDRSLEDLRRRIARDLQDGVRNQHNVIIRPRSTTALLIQLDDFSQAKAAEMEPYAFLILCTSPGSDGAGNYQVWLALSDGPKETDEEAARQFRTRVRRGTGADHSATGATRVAGSLNFKQKYALAFPVVTITFANAGKLTTAAALEQAGLIVPREQPQPPGSVPPQISRGDPKQPGKRGWPDYGQALRGAPRKQDGKPDRSLADFMFCKWAVERGHRIEEVAEKLVQVSKKAQERMLEKNDQGYALLTARNAAAAFERDRNRRRPLKSAADPR